MRLRWDGKVKSNLNIFKYVLPQTNAFVLWLQQYVSNLHKSNMTLEEPGFPKPSKGGFHQIKWKYDLLLP